MATLEPIVDSDTIINGVAVSSTGRIFCSLPRWSESQKASVAEVDSSGQLQPYPDARWNEWQGNMPVGDRFVMAHSVFIDIEDQLWVIDDGSPFFEPFIEGAPKIVQIDLASDRVVRVIPIASKVLTPRGLLGHLRRHGDHLFVTESHGRAIIVVDLRDGSMRRVLGSHPSTAADPSIVPVIDGQEFRKASTGKPQLIHVNLLELGGALGDSDERGLEWLYYCALFGPKLWRVKLQQLIDPTMVDDDLASGVEEVCDIPPLAGITRDADGNLILCSITGNAILKLGADRQLRTLIADERISFPNEPSFGPDGALYFPSSQVQRLALFQTDGLSRVSLPFQVFRLDLQ